MITLSSQHTPYSWSAEGPVSHKELLAHAATVASELPNYQYVVNLCEDRYLFSVGFLAALRRGQVTLLPPAREKGSVLEAVTGFGECYVLVDRGVTPPQGRPHHVLDYVRARGGWRRPAFADWVEDPSKPAVVAFTSGSTGVPQLHPKTWRSLTSSTRLALRRFGLSGYHMVATVPPQHMYGLECTVLYPLLERVAVYAGRPFFPEDICTALESLPAPRVLVTSPLHLRACLGAGLTWARTDLVISATAPLPRPIAAEVEDVWGARVLEIYGCTETGAIASREPTVSNRWVLYDGMRLEMKESVAYVSGPQLDEATRLPDVIRKVDDTSFDLVGRAMDQINIAGKRASLSELNRKLLAIDGVEDGVIVMCDSGDVEPVVRPIALVVAPSLDETRLRARLGEVMPAIFVPRPIYLVPSLPRTPTGKLPRDEVLALVKAQRRGRIGPKQEKSDPSGASGAGAVGPKTRETPERATE